MFLLCVVGGNQEPDLLEQLRKGMVKSQQDEVKRNKEYRRRKDKTSGWGISQYDYSFLRNLDNDNSMRDRIVDILSRVNPRIDNAENDAM